MFEEIVKGPRLLEAEEMPLSSTQSLDGKAQNPEMRCSSKAKMSPFSVITCHR